jgi:hypothetical protein
LLKLLQNPSTHVTHPHATDSSNDFACARRNCTSFFGCSRYLQSPLRVSFADFTASQAHVCFTGSGRSQIGTPCSNS